MDLFQLLGSLAAIFVLAAIAGRLFPANGKLTPERVARNIARYCPDIMFSAADARIIMGDGHKVAILLFPGTSDGIAVATALGDRVVVRHFPDISQLSATKTADGITLATHDFTQPKLSLTLDEAGQSDLLTALSSNTQSTPGAIHA